MAGADRRRVYPRGTDEFSRVLALSDGLFGIAMTLLVLTIAVPALRDPGSERELLDALGDLQQALISWLISFIVIGRFWFAHHQFLAMLHGVDRRLIGLNLAYLGVIAFMPFPTDLLGNYFQNPIATVAYALTLAAASGMEVVLLAHAHRAGLLQRPLTPAVYRWGMTSSLSPVAFALLSIPVAFASTTLAVLLWFGGLPLHYALLRFKPEGADELLSA
jgi:uncharacterized membrane protein